MSNIEIITKSRLADFATCQRLHDIKYNQLIRSVQPRELADWGTVFHAGLDAWWTAYMEDSRPATPLLALPNAEAAMLTARVGLAVDDFAMAKALVMMIAYDARWAPTMAEWEVLGVEVEFIATIPGRRRLRVAGKLDKLLRKRATNRVWFVEHKTTGVDLSEGSTYWQRLKMDPQVSIYYRGVAALGHDDLDGCLYDVVDRPKTKPLKATPIDKRKYTKPTKKDPVSRLYANQREIDETVEEYRDRLGAQIAAAPDAFFARAEVVRLESELQASDQDIEEVALQIRQGSLTGVAPRNPGACFLYNRPCEMLDACSGAASLDDPSKFKKMETAHPELSIDAPAPGGNKVPF
jgi:hypothetical protein